MRVIRDRTTGKIIEAQSGDRESFDAMFANALAAGYERRNLTTELIPDTELRALLVAQDIAESPALGDRPPSVEEQLAAIWEGGQAAEEMRERVMASRRR